MIMLNLFIGVITNSMGEMHAEMAERDLEQHRRETGSPTIEDDLTLIEQQLKDLQDRLATTRHRVAHLASANGTGGRYVRELEIKE